MHTIRMPVVKNPWDKKDYLVLLHAPVRDARPGVAPTYMQVVGINRDNEHKQFSVPLLEWQLADQNPITLAKTAAPTPEQAIALPGSKLTSPWKIGFAVVNDTVIVHASKLGNPHTHYSLRGLKEDGNETVFSVDRGTFESAVLRPAIFVQIEEQRAPMNLVADPLHA